jgi:protein phosphatase PTC1
VSRAFGDCPLKDFGLIATPFQYKTTLTEGDSHIIVACDGIWDVFSDEEAATLVKDLDKEGKNCEDIAKALGETALKKGSRDNITAMIVKF